MEARVPLAIGPGLVDLSILGLLWAWGTGSGVWVYINCAFSAVFLMF